MHKLVIALFVLTLGCILFMAACPVTRDMIAHDTELALRESKVDELKLSDFGNVIYKHSDVGLLFGNGNHTDFWVVRILQTPQPVDDVIRQLNQRADNIDFPGFRIQKAAEAMDEDTYDWKQLGVYSRYHDRTDLIIVQHFGQTDAGYDPRSH